MNKNEVSIQTKNYSVQILDIIRSNHTDEELKMLLVQQASLKFQKIYMKKQEVENYYFIKKK